MTPEDRAWIKKLRATKTSGPIGWGCRQMRRLLDIVDALDAEAEYLARHLVASDEQCPADRFCEGPARPGCQGLKDIDLCCKCWRHAATSQEKTS